MKIGTSMYLERCWVCNADEAEKYRIFQEYKSKGVVLNTSKELVNSNILWLKFQPQIFQPQASTPDFSTMKFSTPNFSNHNFSNMNFSTLCFEN